MIISILSHQKAIHMNITTGTVLILGLAAAALAQTKPADKSQYNLFNPTPKELMREMTTDRPDVTESPYTIDAGHLQIESSFIEYTRDDEPVATDSYSVLPTNFRIGVTNNLELSVNVQPYNVQQSGNDSTAGMGSTELRLKANFWGDDGDSKTAAGIMPIVRLPTGPDAIGTDEVEPGVAAMFAVKLTEKVQLGLMAEVDFVRGPDDPSYQTEFLHTASLSFPIVGELNGYVEYAGIASTGATYLAFADLGLTYQLNDNTQLDAGVNIGLSDSADDFTVFSGISVRL
jgi:hypothetical protein